MGFIKNFMLVSLAGMMMVSLTACSGNDKTITEASSNDNSTSNKGSSLDKEGSAGKDDSKGTRANQLSDETEQKEAEIKDWVRAGDLGTLPQRITDSLPLSDQSNKGGWVKYAPLSDEFGGKALDSSKWWDHNPDWKGRQPGYFYTENVQLGDGKLNLLMKKEEVADMPKGEGYNTYTSAAVKSREKVLYGYFEIRAKAMNSAGSSAFWFYDNTPDWWTEIDVFEIAGNAHGFEHKVNMDVHVFHTPGNRKHWNKHAEWISPWKLSDDYHVYGLEWDKAEIKFYIDGVMIRSITNKLWQQPLYMNFDSETMPDWFGLPNDSDLPSTFSIDYVRAWKKV